MLKKILSLLLVVLTGSVQASDADSSGADTVTHEVESLDGSLVPYGGGSTVASVPSEKGQLLLPSGHMPLVADDQGELVLTPDMLLQYHKHGMLPRLAKHMAREATGLIKKIKISEDSAVRKRIEEAAHVDIEDCLQHPEKVTHQFDDLLHAITDAQGQVKGMHTYFSHVGLDPSQEGALAKIYYPELAGHEASEEYAQFLEQEVELLLLMSLQERLMGAAKDRKNDINALRDLAKQEAAKTGKKWKQRHMLEKARSTMYQAGTAGSAAAALAGTGYAVKGEGYNKKFLGTLSALCGAGLCAHTGYRLWKQMQKLEACDKGVKNHEEVQKKLDEKGHDDAQDLQEIAQRIVDLQQQMQQKREEMMARKHKVVTDKPVQHASAAVGVEDADAASPQGQSVNMVTRFRRWAGW